MENSKEFPLASVLSILLDKILVEKVGDIRMLCSFLTGEEIYTHQMSRAVTECMEGLKKQCPQFNRLDRDEITPENSRVWIEQKEEEYGKTVLLTPITDRSFNFGDPVGDMKTPNKIIIW